MHPGGENAASPRDDPREALTGEFHVTVQNARVNRHVVDTLFRLLAERFVEGVPREGLGLFHLLERLVDRHGSERHGTVAQHRAADAPRILSDRQVHHRVGAAQQSFAKLFEFRIQIGNLPCRPEIRVHLGAELLPDHRGFGLAVADVRRNHGFARGDEPAHVLARPGFHVEERRELFCERFIVKFVEPLLRGLEPLVFTPRHEAHLGRDDALLRRRELRVAPHGAFAAQFRMKVGDGRVFVDPVLAEGTRHVGKKNRRIVAAPEIRRRGRKVDASKGDLFSRFADEVVAHARKALHLVGRVVAIQGNGLHDVVSVRRVGRRTLTNGRFSPVFSRKIRRERPAVPPPVLTGSGAKGASQPGLSPVPPAGALCVGKRPFYGNSRRRNPETDKISRLFVGPEVAPTCFPQRSQAASSIVSPCAGTASFSSPFSFANARSDSLVTVACETPSRCVAITFNSG